MRAGASCRASACDFAHPTRRFAISFLRSRWIASQPGNNSPARAGRSKDEVVRAQVRDTLDAHAPAGEGQNRFVDLGLQRHRGIVVPVLVPIMPVAVLPVPVAPCQLGKTGVEAGQVDPVLAPREVLDHVTARARAVSVPERAELERVTIVVVSVAMPDGG